MYGSFGLQIFRFAFDDEDRWNFFVADIEKSGIIVYGEKLSKIVSSSFEKDNARQVSSRHG